MTVRLLCSARAHSRSASSSSRCAAANCSARRCSSLRARGARRSAQCAAVSSSFVRASSSARFASSVRRASACRGIESSTLRTMSAHHVRCCEMRRVTNRCRFSAPRVVNRRCASIPEKLPARHTQRASLAGRGTLPPGGSMGLVCYALILLAPISLAVTLIAHLAVFLVISPNRKRRSGPTPPITVLKPVKGDEEGLYENLASLARQDYPEYEILVGAEDALDPALEVARSVQADHPAARIHIQAGSRRLGLNPKVNLLSALTERARHDHLLVSDSNVRVRESYLRETAAELGDPQVGLVTNLVVGEEGGCLGAVLESLQLNSFVASATSFARVVAGRACVIGKSMLFRRDDFESLGGFWSVRNVLAEDYLIGRAFELAGYRVALSPHVVTTVNCGWTAERFANRHLRWAQMRRRICLPAYLAELLLNPGMWIALA